MHHPLELSEGALHGSFHPNLRPALEVQSGDTIELTTLDVAWGLGQHPYMGTTREKFPHEDSHRNRGPALSGPIAIANAKPGDWLEVEVLNLEPFDWGWTWIGDNGFNSALVESLGLPKGKGELLRWTLDHDRNIATSDHEHEVPLAPFFGTLGLCNGSTRSSESVPEEQQWQNGWWPQVTGGNLDCRELGVGARVFLPVEVAGGLLSLGDAHAAQGDGEIAGSAIECRVRATIRTTLHDRVPGLESAPLERVVLAKNPEDHWVTFGMHRDLDEAIPMAIRQGLAILQGLTTEDSGQPSMAAPGTAAGDITAGNTDPRYGALAYLSAAGHLRFSQVVNGVRGVHLVLPR